MAKYMTEQMKSHFRMEKEFSCKCRRCRRRERGLIVSFNDRLTTAVDGTKARRLYFVCHEKSHLNLLGYSKPVDFRKNLPTQDQSEMALRAYEDEDREIEQEWNELEENARLRRRTFH